MMNAAEIPARLDIFLLYDGTVHPNFRNMPRGRNYDCHLYTILLTREGGESFGVRYWAMKEGAMEALVDLLR